MTVKLKDLDRIIREATGHALSEVLGPLRETKEEDRQEYMVKRLMDMQADSPSEDLEEAETEDTEEPKFVKKKAITGRQSDEAPGDEPAEEEEVEPPSEEQLADPEIGTVIKALNILRSGKSTKDPTTKKNLKIYFDGLDVGEKQALLVILDSLSKIIAKGVEGKEALDPSQAGVEIEPAQVEEPAQAKKVPSVTRGRSQPGDKELPIVVGESAKKEKLLQRVRLLRK